MVFLWLVILLAGTVSCSPLSGHNSSEDSFGSHINITTSPFDRIVNLRVTNDIVYSTPATVLVGTKRVLRCLQEDPNVCEDFFASYGTVTSLLVAGEYYYVGLGSGDIYKCNLDRKESCEMFLSAGSQVDALVSADGKLLAGLFDGRVIKCRLHEPSTCRDFQLHENSTVVFALMQFHEHIYAGVSDKLLRCSLTGKKCKVMENTGAGTISGLTSMGDSIFAVSFGDGTLWKCSTTDAATSCESRALGYTLPRDIALYNGELYTVENNEGMFKCKWENPIVCTSYGDFKYVYSMVFVYGTYKMQSRYINENVTCKGSLHTGQYNATCPPAVIYFDVQQRRQFEVEVKDGKLYDASGVLVDTSNADQGRSGPAAIFAMTPDGKIMLSKKHVTQQLHSSSLVAGNPVSGAGEIVVKNGVIENITACSDHYQPDLNLNRQVIESLHAQGYTDHIESQLCKDDDDGFQQSDSNNVQ